jgi:hypothetical protein
MPQNDLRERVAELEKQVAELRAELASVRQAPEKDWRRTIGMFDGDEGMRELFDEAMKIRDADRRRARRSSKKQAQAAK